VTATATAAPGYLTVHPCGGTTPVASNLNFGAGATVANAVQVALDSHGRACIFASVTADVVVDVFGAFVDDVHQRFQPLVPARIVDTRTGVGGATRLRAGVPVAVRVAGVGGVPAAGASAVTFTLTAVAPSAPSYVTAYPCDATGAGAVPATSNVNLGPGEIRPNLVTVPIGTSGMVCFVALADTDIVVDLAGAWSGTGSLFQPLDPVRIVDTRAGKGGTRLDAGTVLRVPVAGNGTVPSDATAVALNATVTAPAAAGFVTIYPCDATPPTASNLDFTAAQTTANAAAVRLAADGSVCVYAMTVVDVVLDVDGVWRP
jgi:hypothetical protein